MFLSKRGGVYYLFFQDEGGKRRKVSTKCSYKSDALKYLQNFKAQEHQRQVRLQRTSLSEFTADFLTNAKTNRTPSTLTALEIALRVFQRHVGDVPMQKIGVREVEGFLTKRKADGVSAYTLRFYYIALASALETARRWNLISTNPFRSVEKPPVPQLQPAHFTKEEFRVLLNCIQDNDFKELCVCGVFTGLRLSELTALQWTDIDLALRLIHVRNSDTFTTKSKKNRVVPMNEQLWALLAGRKEQASCELVFHNSGRRLTKDEVSKTFKKVVKGAKVNDKLHFHSLRHTFATWLVQDGVSLYEVQKLLGHSNISVTEIYSHLQPQQLHSTVNRIALMLN